jgi:hypothetical protein
MPVGKLWWENLMGEPVALDGRYVQNTAELEENRGRRKDGRRTSQDESGGQAGRRFRKHALT